MPLAAVPPQSRWKLPTGPCAMFVEGNVAELMMMQEPSQR